MGAIVPAKPGTDAALNTGQGLLSQAFSRLVSTSQSAPGTGTAYLTEVGLVSGQTATNVAVQVTTAAAGTVPTTVTMALCDGTGKVLAITAELKNDAQWLSTGEKRFALGTPYPVPTTTGYYVAFLVVGSWTVTGFQFARGLANAAYTTSFAGAIHPTVLGGTGLSNLPAVNSSLTISPVGGVGFWHGVN